MPVIQPTSTSLEKWMRIPVGGGTLFMFSGFAWFGSDIEGPLWDVSGLDGLVGAGDTDTSDQGDLVFYEIPTCTSGRTGRQCGRSARAWARPDTIKVRRMKPTSWATGYEVSTR